MIIHKSIVHVLDKNSDSPILNDYELRNSLEIDTFFQKIIGKIAKDDDLRKCTYKTYNDNVIQSCCEQMIYDQNTFLENSKEIAAYLFDVMQTSQEIESCDLAICLFSIKDQTNVAIIKFNYQQSYTHIIDFEEDKFNIQISKNEIGISMKNMPKQAALVGVSGVNDEWHLRVLDKDAEKEEVNSSFTEGFLKVNKVIDDKYKTKMTLKHTEEFIENTINADVKKAEEVRAALHYNLLKHSEFNIEDFAEFHIDENIREEYLEYMKGKGVEGTFFVDSEWTSKKLKNRSLKTDTGFTLKGKLSDLEDPMKYSLRKNENGTFDIVIKNVGLIS